MAEARSHVFVPERIVLTRGVGKHKEKLTSFELALRNARIAQYNLVQVSSVFPPHCKVIGRDKGLPELAAGQVTYAVVSRAESCEPHRLMAASVGLAIPKDASQYGYLSEHHSYGQTAEQAGEYAEDLAAEMLATLMGVEFDADASWDDRREQWRISGKIVKTRNITQSAVGDKDGRWTTVLAAAIFIP